VALAMLVVMAILVWKKVPAAIGRALDKKIAGIREQLDEAAQLRAEAEAIKAEYEAKAAQAGAEADLML
jgi:F-type H+-transporting ATPase subunit b